MKLSEGADRGPLEWGGGGGVAYKIGAVPYTQDMMLQKKVWFAGFCLFYLNLGPFGPVGRFQGREGYLPPGPLFSPSKAKTSGLATGESIKNADIKGK